MSGVAIDQEWAKAAILEPRSPNEASGCPQERFSRPLPGLGTPGTAGPQEIPSLSVSPSRSPSTALPQAMLVTGSEASMRATDDYDDDLDSPQ
jgi:hypothetical protein